MRNLELPGRSPVHAPTGMAATSHPLSSQVAIDVLKSGGNAMDAAIAACAVQCVVEPQSTGIGGDNFCLYSKNGSSDVVAFNGSGKAPAAADVTWFQERQISSIERFTPHAITVPSAVDAWCKLIEDYGNKEIGDVLQPAIGYAREGYPLHSRVSMSFNRNEALLRRQQYLSDVFLTDGALPRVGSRLRHPQLANTLEKIAEDGRDAFYTGDMAESMVNYLQSIGGLHTLDDFNNVGGNYVQPISTSFRDYDVIECPPNGQGVIALLLLNIMSAASVDNPNPINVERLHLELEACRLAYRSRNMFVADPTYAKTPLQQLLSKEYAKELYDLIDPTQSIELDLDTKFPRHNDTVYITVVDKDRNCCSFINTVFDSFGSGYADPDTGVVFHNRGCGFVVDPDSPNCIAGGKRPLHTIIPGMVSKNDRIVMPFGVMGGQYQAFGHMQFLTRFFDYGMDIQESMDLPRSMVDPYTGEVELEGAISDSIMAELQAMGHRVRRAEQPIGGSQAIWLDWAEGILTGGSDPRKDGCVIGY